MSATRDLKPLTLLRPSVSPASLHHAVALLSASSLCTSPDGVTAGSEFDAVAWSGAEFRAVGYYAEVATSSDGMTWAVSNLGSGKNLFGLASSGSQFVAVGQGGAVFTSR